MENPTPLRKIRIPRSTKNTEELFESMALLLMELIFLGCEDHEVTEIVDAVTKMVERREDRAYIDCRTRKFLVIRRGRYLEIHRA